MFDGVPCTKPSGQESGIWWKLQVKYGIVAVLGAAGEVGLIIIIPFDPGL
jgi:hypothetical protein